MSINNTKLSDRIALLTKFYTDDKNAEKYYWNTGKSVMFADPQNGTTIGTTTDSESEQSSEFNGYGCHAFAQYFLSIATGHYLLVNSNTGSEETDPWEKIPNGSITDVKVGDLVRCYVDNGNQHTAIIVADVNDSINDMIQTIRSNCEIIVAPFNYDGTVGGLYLDSLDNIKTNADYIVRLKDSNNIKEQTIHLSRGGTTEDIIEVQNSLFFNLPDASEYITPGAGKTAVWKTVGTGETKYCKNGAAIPYTTSFTLEPAVVASPIEVNFDLNTGTLPSGVKAAFPNEAADETRFVAANGKYTEEYDTTYYTITANALPTPTCTSSAYEFTGWYTESDCSGTSISDSSTVGIYGPITLYAGWKVRTVAVNYVDNATGKTVSREYDADNIVVEDLGNEFVREGYTLLGWKYGSSDTVYEKGDVLPVVSADTVELTAEWERTQVMITFYLHGGTLDGSTEDRSYSYATGLGATFGQKTVPTPTKYGYDFDGWWTDAVGGSKYVESTVIPAWGFSLHARWSPKSVTVSLIASNGLPAGVTPNISENSLTVNYDSMLSSASLPQPDCNGRYDFVGWYVDSACTVSANGYKVETTGTLTLYAKWTCTVSFVSGVDDIEEEIELPDDVTGIAIGAQFELPATVPVHPDGWYFKGWSSSCDNNRYYYGGASVPVPENVTLTAQWEEPYVVINYENTSVDFVGTPVYLSAAENGKIPCSVLADYEVGVGMHVKSWKIKGDNSGTVYTPGDPDLYLPEFKNYILEVAQEFPYAEYSVSFDANGGTAAPAAVCKYHGQRLLVPKEEPYHESCTFLGWSDSPYGEVKYAPGSEINEIGDVTLYAVWMNSCYVVRFDTGTLNSDAYPAYDPPLSVTYPVLRDENGELREDAGITLPTEIPSREGYVFRGWSYNDYIGYNHTVYAGQNLTVDGAYNAFDPMGMCTIFLYALWEEDTEPKYATVKLVDTNTGTGIDETVKNIKVKYGDIYDMDYTDGYARGNAFFTLSPCNGKYFIGWADESGRIVNKYDTVTVTYDHTLYSVWEENTFTDAINDWAIEAVVKCKYYKYLTGTSDTVFSADASATRAQAMVTLYRMAGTPDMGNTPFADVYGEGELARSVTWALDNGITNGKIYNDPEGVYLFGATENVTRRNMAVFFYRYAAALGLGVTVTDTTTAQDAVNWAADNGIFDGTDLDGVLTRAQLAVMLIRFKELARL